MLMYIKDIAKQCNVTESTIRMYLDRSEFNKNRTTKSFVLDMQPEDILRLKELVKNRIGGRFNTYETFEVNE